MLLRPKSQMLHLSDDIHSVFLGNSTFEYGIDDRKIPNTKNFAQNAETIDLLYAKLKILKTANPNLDTVYIELDDIILLNTKMPSVLSHPYLINEFTLKDIFTNLTHRSFERNTAYISHIYDFIKIRPLIIGNIKGGDITQLGIGGYSNLYRDKLTEDLKNRSSQVKQEIPEINIYYYNSVIEYCKEKGISPIFLATPVHKSTWNKNIHKSFKEKYFPEIKMIDCSNMELPDSCFGDRYHLNHKGARIYSDSLRSIIFNLQTCLSHESSY